MKLSLTALLIAIWLGSVQAQGPEEQNDMLAKRSFYLDYAAFRDTLPGYITLEVYYKIFSADLSFKKWGEKYRANYSVDITVDHNNKQVTGISRDGELVADTYKETRAKDDFIINRIVFKVPPDDYTVTAHLNDPASGELMKAKKSSLKLKNFNKNLPHLSSLELLREAKPSQEDSEFVRSNLVLIPSVSHIYGEGDPELIVYYEIYNDPNFQGNYDVHYEIHVGEKKALTDSATFSATGAATSRLERFRVDNYQPGEYTLKMVVQAPGKKFHLAESIDFYIGWSVMAIVKNDWPTAVAQLRYVASFDEIKKMSSIKLEDRIKSWEDFWKKKDPTPSTEENELRDEYYRRIRYSDLNFGNFGKNGWKSDMGMIYVRFGPPDEVERHPFDIDSKPYQIWYYYTSKRVFTFVDVKGYGDFELVYPFDGDLQKVR